jgi:apolipoprotein N-acyltransferase
MPLGVTPRQGLLALGSGLLGAAAFAPLGLWPLLLVSIALFLWLLRDADVAVARNLGMVYGLAFGAGTMYWMFLIFGALTVALILLMGVYFCALAWLIALSRSLPVLARAALVGLFAVAIEWLRGDAWYLRFPWYTAPHALAIWPPLIAGVRWLGVYGLSFVIWFVIAAGVFGRPYWLAALLLLPVPWLLLPAEATPDRRAILFQTEQGKPPADILLVTFLKYPAEEPIDLAVFPELAFAPRSPEAVLAGKNGPAALASMYHCPVVFGAELKNTAQKTWENVAAIVGPDGTLLGTFTKQRPVPLFDDGKPGVERPVFPVEQGVLGVAICYDFDAPAVAGSLVASGATVLVLPTLDHISWSRVQHEHHELLCRLRAVENDRWLVRAASSGRSEVITPRGVPSATGIEIDSVGTITLPYGHRDTFALGGRLAFLGPGAAVATLVFLGWLAFRRRPATTL